MNTTTKYILDEHGQPVPEPDLLKWANWIEASYSNASRTVALHKLGPCAISTVFLGLDHSFTPDAPPVLWETMFWGGKLDGWTCRYTSRDDAEKGHLFALAHLVSDYRNFVWRTATSRKRRRKRFRQVLRRRVTS